MMSYSFDYFAGEMLCGKCGVISPKNASTNMQTKICKVHHMAMYKIGSKIQIDEDNIDKSGYLCSSRHAIPGSMKLIESWDCPSCNASFNWGIVSIERGVIQSISEISLTAESISAVNYVTDDVRYFGWDVKDGVPFQKQEMQ